MLRDPALVIVGISTVVGGWLKTVGVKLFSGIVGGGVTPIGDTVISGVTILIIVPGVVEGIVALFAGMNIIGIVKSVGKRVKSIIVHLVKMVVMVLILVRKNLLFYQVHLEHLIDLVSISSLRMMDTAI